MRFRPAALLLLLLNSPGASNSSLKNIPGGVLSQEVGGKRSTEIRCTIATKDVRWRVGDKDTAVEVYIQSKGATDLSVLPSLHMILLPKKQGLDPNEYWAPFAIPNGASTKKTQKLSTTGDARTLSVRLVPARLLWASTKTSVWPSQEFAKIILPGKYSLNVQLEIDGGRTISSNGITVSVLK